MAYLDAIHTSNRFLRTIYLAKVPRVICFFSRMSSSICSHDD